MPTENHKKNSIADCSVIASESNKLVDSYSIHAFCSRDETMRTAHYFLVLRDETLVSRDETRLSSRKSGNLHLTGTVPWCLGVLRTPFLAYFLNSLPFLSSLGGRRGRGGRRKKALGTRLIMLLNRVHICLEKFT